MNTVINETFEEIYMQNTRRIYYHIHKLNVDDSEREYYQEGLCAMWNAYEAYRPDKGTMGTYFNYIIRNRLIDLHRREMRVKQVEEIVVKEKKKMLHEGNKIQSGEASYHIINNDVNLGSSHYVWQQVKSYLTENQWKWVYYYIILELPVKEIAAQDNTTVDAVKGWGRQVRKKLNKEEVRGRLKLELGLE